MQYARPKRQNNCAKSLDSYFLLELTVLPKLRQRREKMKIHVDKIMDLGLDFGGYDIDRRATINKLATKVTYFVSFYGYAPASFVPLFDDLCNSEAALDVLKRPPVLSEVLMMANWFKEGLTFNSLGGKFKMNPDTAAKKCWKYAEAVAAMYAEKVCTFAVLVPPTMTRQNTQSII
jgi:hypothetical protein